MAASLKKAGSIIRKSFRSNRVAHLKENIYSISKETSQKGPEPERFRVRSESMCASSGDEMADISTIANPSTPPRSQLWLRRGTSVTQSMRDAVGTIRQKLRTSTRRARLQMSQTRVSKRRHTVGGRRAQLNSPKKSGRTSTKICLSSETPTRLKREVETLTSNMQALSALTPNMSETRSRTARKSPLTNGSLKTPRSIRRRVMTEIN